LYGQNVENQSGDPSPEKTRGARARSEHGFYGEGSQPNSLATFKLVTNGSGKVLPVDENGRSIVFVFVRF
jgi:hypothetical protein